MDFQTLPYWGSKDLYVQLMERFISGEISGIEFEREFYRMWTADRDKEKESRFKGYLKNIEVSYFLDLIDGVFTACDCFEPDPSLRKHEVFDISEEQLKECVQQTLLEIKSRYP